MATDSLNELRRIGLLLKTDAALPSVTTIVAGEPVRGSWWAHPAGRRIFQTLRDLSQHPDIVVVKLVSGKDTLVHRALWPELYALATSNEPWQRVSSEARRLLQRVGRAGVFEASGDIPRELERHLLVIGEQFHAVEGHHGKQLESWTHWADRVRLDPRRVTAAEAKAVFTAAMTKAKFPWSSPPR